MSGSWPLLHERGTAAAFHAREVPEPVERALWWFDVAAPALVLGSTQSDSIVDRGRAEAAGVEVARRRSGGGAVWLAPGEATWIDVVLPATDPRWDHDVSRAAHWLGDAWRGALASLGIEGAAVHRGPMVTTRWSGLVCFAGLGPGEVTVGGRKVVGISQRRTRSGARFQCAVLHRWEPSALLDLLHLEGDAAAVTEITGAAIGIEELAGVVAAADVVDALRSVLAGTFPAT